MPITLHSEIPNKPKAIGFDCYKTLFSNSEDGWIELFKEIIFKQKIPLSPENFWKKWKNYEVDFRKNRTDLGRPSNSPKFKPYQEAWTICFKKVFDDINFNGDFVEAGVMSSDHLREKPIFEETLEVLEKLSKNYKIGLFSNADHNWIIKLLKSHKMKFDLIASSELAQTYKPSLKAFEFLANGLREKENNIWYVGDNEIDVEFAKKNKCSSIFIENKKFKKKKLKQKPDLILKKIEALELYIK